MTYGYIRVSTKDQNLARQYASLEGWGVQPDNIYQDKASGKNFDREGYRQVRQRLQAGDVLYLDSLDRLGRDYDGIISEWKHITREIGADIVCIDKAELFDSRKFRGMGDIGKVIEDMVLSAMSYVAEQERVKTLRRQREGIAAAKAAGTYNPGRPRKEVIGFSDMLKSCESGEMSVTEACRILGIGRTTWYNLVKDRATAKKSVDICTTKWL